MSKLASIRAMVNNRSVIQEVIEEPSISDIFPFIACSVKMGQSWQQPILEFLTIRKVLKEEKEAKRIRRISSSTL